MTMIETFKSKYNPDINNVHIPGNNLSLGQRSNLSRMERSSIILSVPEVKCRQRSKKDSMVQDLMCCQQQMYRYLEFAIS